MNRTENITLVIVLELVCAYFLMLIKHLLVFYYHVHYIYIYNINIHVLLYSYRIIVLESIIVTCLFMETFKSSYYCLCVCVFFF